MQLYLENEIMKLQKADLRRRKAFGGLVGVALLIATLIYLEQIVILFLLANGSLIWLLIVVAFADLERAGLDENEQTPTSEPGDKQK